MGLITLSEYAKKVGKNQGNISRKFRNGDFKTAFKVGKIVWIDEDEPLSDRRLINGRYVDYRKNLRAGRERKAQKFSGVSEESENTAEIEAEQPSRSQSPET